MDTPETSSGGPPIVWDRRCGAVTSAARGDGTDDRAVCLWARGYLAAPQSLARRLGLPATCATPEIIEAVFEREGPEAALALEGACSWVVWDRRHRELLLVRDRVGTESLFFALLGEKVAVGPDAATLAAQVPGGARLHVPSLVAHIQGLAPPSGRSFFSGVASVEAAERVTLSGGRTLRRRYWDAGGAAAQDDDGAAQRLADTLLAVAADSVPQQDCGIALSSGLDSTSLAAAVSEVGACRLTALTWASPELPEADETAAAAQVAVRLGLPQIGLRADRAWPLSSGRLASDPDAPPLLPLPDLWHAACRTARQAGLATLLTGAGGDHLFGYAGAGPYAYVDLLLGGRWWALTRQLRMHRRSSPATLTRILDRDLLRPVLRWYLPWLRPSRRPLPWLLPAHRGLARDLLAQSESAVAPRPGRALPGRRFRLAVLSHPSLSRIACEIGRSARSHGLEARHLWLDRRLIELAAALPSSAAFRAGVYKAVVREAMQRRLPEDVLKRRDKTYSFALFHRGLREREARRVRDLLTGMAAAELGLVDEARLRLSYERYQAGDDDARFWPALTLEDWLRRYR